MWWYEREKRTSEVLKRVETPPFVCEGLLRALDPVQVLLRLYSTRCKLFQDESSPNIENIQVEDWEKRALFTHLELLESSLFSRHGWHEKKCINPYTSPLLRSQNIHTAQLALCTRENPVGLISSTDFSSCLLPKKAIFKNSNGTFFYFME